MNELLLTQQQIISSIFFSIACVIKFSWETKIETKARDEVFKIILSIQQRLKNQKQDY